jgi:hypothetical protein
MLDLATPRCRTTRWAFVLLILVSASSCADSSPGRGGLQPASCVRNGVECPSGPGDSVPMGDGCNRCVCEDGEITSCTTLLCSDHAAAGGAAGGADVGTTGGEAGAIAVSHDGDTGIVQGGAAGMAE